MGGSDRRDHEIQTAGHSRCIERGSIKCKGEFNPSVLSKVLVQ